MEFVRRWFQVFVSYRFELISFNELLNDYISELNCLTDAIFVSNKSHPEQEFCKGGVDP